MTIREICELNGIKYDKNTTRRINQIFQLEKIGWDDYNIICRLYTVEQLCDMFDCAYNIHNPRRSVKALRQRVCIVQPRQNTYVYKIVNVPNDVYGVKFTFNELLKRLHLDEALYQSKQQQNDFLELMQKHYIVIVDGVYWTIVRPYTQEEKIQHQLKGTFGEWCIDHNIDLKDYSKIGGIYAIKLRDDIYVGQTKNFAYRLEQHYYLNNDTLGYKSRTRDMLRNGGTFEILEIVDDNREQRLIKEREWTDHYKQLGYNIQNSVNVLYKKDIDKPKTSKPRMTTIKVPAENKEAIMALLTEHGLL